MVETIEELRHEIHNLQVAQAKPKQSKPVTSAEPLQGIRDQIMPFRRGEDLEKEDVEEVKVAIPNRELWNIGHVGKRVYVKKMPRILMLLVLQKEAYSAVLP